MPDPQKQSLGYTADAYTPAYLSYAHNVGRMTTPLLVYDLARLDPKAVHLRLHPSMGAEPMYAVETAEEVLLEWNAIMLVTATEAYLQDALAFHARHDPNLMRASEQAAQYAEVVSAGSLSDLADLLRSRWARNFLEKGGPTKWRERLEKLGVRGFPEGMDASLETLWGVRHMLIHNAGIATTDFVQRHPNFGAKVGERIRFQRSHLRTWLDPVDGFVSTYERFLYHRFLKSATDDLLPGDDPEHSVARAVRLLGVNRERLARLVMLPVPDLEQFLLAPDQMPAVVRMRLGLALWHTAAWDVSGPDAIPVDVQELVKDLGREGATTLRAQLDPIMNGPGSEAEIIAKVEEVLRSQVGPDLLAIMPAYRNKLG
jgi:hypothetical protein